MYYSIRHLTKFRYSEHVSESLMEARMQPRSDGPQRCLTFQLMVQPRGARAVLPGLPGQHGASLRCARAGISSSPSSPTRWWMCSPSGVAALAGRSAWDELDADDRRRRLYRNADAQPLRAIQRTAGAVRPRAGRGLAREGAGERDPLQLVLDLNAALYSKIAYVPKSTRVDSPIDHALESRQGVCQDFAHIMIGLARRIGIPCRYVSGYLFHKAGRQDALGRRRHARLGGGAAAGLRMGRLGSDQQCARRANGTCGRPWGAITPTFLPPRASSRDRPTASCWWRFGLPRRTLRRRSSPNWALAKIGRPRCAKRAPTRNYWPLNSSNNNSSSKGEIPLLATAVRA